MAVETTGWNATDYLDSDAAILAYLEAVFEDGDPALIAAALARRTGMAHDPFVLIRRRPTVALRGLGRRDRREAVAGAFAVRARDRVRGKAIGLVDDVYTSGATAAACTRTLLAAGAASVTILCWARVIDDA